MKSSHSKIIAVRSEKMIILIYGFVHASGYFFVVLYYGKENSIIVVAHGVVVKIQMLQIGESSKILCVRLKKQGKGNG